MKTIYDFTIDKELMSQETEETVNDQGEKIKITKEVKKPIPQKYSIKKPTRVLFDDSELFYGVKLSEGVKAGLLTRPLLNKRYVEDGGVLAEKTKDAEVEAYKDLYEFQEELTKLKAMKEEDRPEFFETKKTDVEAKISSIKKSLTDLEIHKEALFDHTAETRARNKVITWWILFLSFCEKNGEVVSFFGEGDYDSRMLKYDEIFESEDEHLIKAANAFVYFISFWYVGRAATKEDFDALKLERGIS